MRASAPANLQATEVVQKLISQVTENYMALPFYFMIKNFQGKDSCFCVGSFCQAYLTFFVKYI
jgi:hypothetical protein